MRIWDLPPEKLCRQHLLGEHRELHALWSIITENKSGYSKHPETLRWVGKLGALYKRHDFLVKEMKKRSYNHKTPLNKKFATGMKEQDTYVDSLGQQAIALKMKGCECSV